MTATRRELIAALGGAWLLASLGALPAAPWLFGPAAPAHCTAPGDGEADHVLNRLGFGVGPADRAEFHGTNAWLDEQLAPDAIDDSSCRQRLRRLETLALPLGEAYEFQPDLLRRELQASIILAAVHSRCPLRESLVDCWRDHFSISIAKGECAWLTTAFERDALRPHALGRFRDLLRAVLLHPAMLWYLDGRLNRTDQGAPNENYARELLELHTLGLDGGYTQRDVQEAARALSGWTSRGLGQSRKGAVSFDAHRHDAGAKHLIGSAIPAGLGADEVERAVDAVCSHPSTARFLARKLCVRYLDDAPPEAAVAAVAAAWSASDGRIGDALRALVTLPGWSASRGSKLKRPLHLVASALRATDAASDGGPALLAHLEHLGHAPWQWPTPDGYPATATHWRSGLLGRWRFADALAGNRIAGTKVDADLLERRCGSREALMAHLLGRAPEPRERARCMDGSPADALAVLLALPGFQRC